MIMVIVSEGEMSEDHLPVTLRSKAGCAVALNKLLSRKDRRRVRNTASVSGCMAAPSQQ